MIELTENTEWIKKYNIKPQSDVTVCAGLERGR